MSTPTKFSQLPEPQVEPFASWLNKIGATVPVDGNDFYPDDYLSWCQQLNITPPKAKKGRK